MSNPAIIIPGIDLSVIPTPTPAQIDQAIRTAYPAVGVGGVILSSTAPDTVTYPALGRFIWSESVDDIDYVPTGNIYTFNGTTWVLYETTTADNILDGSISLAKLEEPGLVNSLYLLRAQSGGGGYELVPVNTAIADGSLPVIKLVAGAASTMLITDEFGTVSWIGMTTILKPLIDASVAAAFLSQVVPPANISHTGAIARMGIVFDGTVVKWAYIDQQIRDGTLTIFALTPEGEIGKVMRSNAAGDGFDYVTLKSGYYTAHADIQALPAAGATAIFAHGLATKPDRAGGFIECVTVDGTFAVGDRVPWDRVYPTEDSGVFWDATNIKLPRLAGAPGYQVQKQDGSGYYAIVGARWKCGAWADYIV